MGRCSPRSAAIFPTRTCLASICRRSSLAAFHERQRAGEFGGDYVHFFHRNLLDRIFEPDSIDTTICNSTLHELWSYAAQEKTVRAYLAEKFRQLRAGGRLIIRDVVGPEKGDEIVFLYCADNDGGDLSGDNWKPLENRAPEWLRELSTRSRFFVFAHDFLAWRRGNGQAEFKFQTVDRTHQPGFLLCLRFGRRVPLQEGLYG